jgi:hypothetical protein
VNPWDDGINAPGNCRCAPGGEVTKCKAAMRLTQSASSEQVGKRSGRVNKHMIGEEIVLGGL